MSTDSDPVLEVIDLAVSFGGVRALDGVSLEVPAGAMFGLIGPNGAGKTTMIDAISGFVPCAGQVLFAGQDLSSAAPHQRARAGLARTWQSLELFDDLTVLENCIVSASRSGIRSFVSDLVRRGSGKVPETVTTAIELLGLGVLAGRYPTEISLGQRKLVGVARALAASPTMILLDEPAAGLDSHESHGLGDRLQEVVASGVSLVLVDHDMGLVLRVCDSLAVLDFGRLVAAGSPAEIRSDKRVIEAYLGSSIGHG